MKIENKNKNLLILMGASGDLFSRKLAPALSRLFSQGRLVDVDIWGVSRKPWSDDQFRSLISKAVSEKEAGQEPSQDFLKKCFFKTTDITDSENLANLLEAVNNLKKEQVYDNVFIFLSVSPYFYETIFQSIKKNKTETGDWLKLIVEKPFGTSLENAEKLNSILENVIPESSIYRIDHYLTKETMQDILAFRFANEIFKPVWNKEHIESIKISMHEAVTVENRAVFYDKVGALFDVGQNHLLQMLVAVTMEEPEEFSDQAFHQSRAKIFEALEVKPEISCIRGQYDQYQDHDGVAKNSQTDTYFSIGLEIKNQNYQGVPIIIESGKGLAEKQSFIEVKFKARKTNIIGNQKNENDSNIITFKLFPDEKIEIDLLGKTAGFNSELKKRNFSFSIQDTPEYTGADIAYEHVFYEALSQDRTLFAGKTETILGWKLVETAKEALLKKALIKYKLGTRPQALHDILDK